MSSETTTTASPIPISPFTSYSVPSEPTSDELPDLGAFTTVLRAFQHLQPPPRIVPPLPPSTTSSSITNTTTSHPSGSATPYAHHHHHHHHRTQPHERADTDTATRTGTLLEEGSTVWSHLPIAHYLHTPTATPAPTPSLDVPIRSSGSDRDHRLPPSSSQLSSSLPSFLSSSPEHPPSSPPPSSSPPASPSESASVSQSPSPSVSVQLQVAEPDLENEDADEDEATIHRGRRRRIPSGRHEEEEEGDEAEDTEGARTVDIVSASASEVELEAQFVGGVSGMPPGISFLNLTTTATTDTTTTTDTPDLDHENHEEVDPNPHEGPNTPSLGYLDAALNYLASERQRWSALRSGPSSNITAGTGGGGGVAPGPAWKHVVEPRRKRRRKRPGRSQSQGAPPVGTSTKTTGLGIGVGMGSGGGGVAPFSTSSPSDPSLPSASSSEDESDHNDDSDEEDEESDPSAPFSTSQSTPGMYHLPTPTPRHTHTSPSTPRAPKSTRRLGTKASRTRLGMGLGLVHSRSTPTLRGPPSLLDPTTTPAANGNTTTQVKDTGTNSQTQSKAETKSAKIAARLANIARASRIASSSSSGMSGTVSIVTTGNVLLQGPASPVSPTRTRARGRTVLASASTPAPAPALIPGKSKKPILPSTLTAPTTSSRQVEATRTDKVGKLDKVEVGTDPRRIKLERLAGTLQTLFPEDRRALRGVVRRVREREGVWAREREVVLGVKAKAKETENRGKEKETENRGKANGMGREREGGQRGDREGKDGRQEEGQGAEGKEGAEGEGEEDEWERAPDPDPRGREVRSGDRLIHVFVDHSNILIGLLSHLRRFPIPRAPRPLPPIPVTVSVPGIVGNTTTGSGKETDDRTTTDKSTERIERVEKKRIDNRGAGEQDIEVGIDRNAGKKTEPQEGAGMSVKERDRAKEKAKQEQRALLKAQLQASLQPQSSQTPTNTATDPVPPKKRPRHLSHPALTLILERGRPISRRVLVTSSPLYQPMHTIERLGYEVRVYVRVPDLGGGADRERGGGREREGVVYGAKKGAGGEYGHGRTGSGGALGVSGGSGAGQGKGKVAVGGGGGRGHTRGVSGSAGTSAESEVGVGFGKGGGGRKEGNAGMAMGMALSAPVVSTLSGGLPRASEALTNTNSNANSITNSNTNANSSTTNTASQPQPAPRIRYREQGVDELLQLKLHQALAATDVVPPGATIVLATGDGNVGQFNEDGFLGPVRTALRRGWKVELYAWEDGLSRAWRREFGEGSEWGRKGMFRVVGLEQFAASLVDDGW